MEIADAPETRARGLMFRRDLPPERGMLFLFGSDRRLSFWMKNTPLSLDMLFIQSTGEIVAIVESTPPLSVAPISPPVEAASLLEVNAGTAERLGLAVGDRVRHPRLDGPERKP